MWGLYRETDCPSTVEDAVYCHFISPLEKNLCTTGANNLRIFRLNHHIVSKGSNDSKKGPRERETKLECLLTFKFLAPICSMASATIPRSQRDCLLLGFEEAKLSIVAYDPRNHDLVTLSIHSFEEELLRGGLTRDLPLPLVRADPESRCGVMLVYGRHLGIVPFLDRGADTSLDFLDYGSAGPVAAHKTPKCTLFSYSLTLETLDERLQNVSDMCFLQGYYEPTLLMLYEPMQTTAGRIAIRHDTYCILAVSLNVKDKVHAVIWTVNLLPYDCFRCLSVPKPIGGVIIIAANSIIYLNQSVPAYGVSVNSCMRGATSFPLKDEEQKRLSLDVSAAAFILPSTLILSLHNGDIHTLTMLVDNTNVLKGIQLDQTAEGSAPTAVCACDDGFFFVGSRVGDSLLFRYKEANTVAVKVTSEPGQRAGEAGGSIEALDDLAIYGEVVAVTTVETMRVIQYRFEECDRMMNIGPCRSMTLGIPAEVPEPLQTQQMDPIVDMVFGCGLDKSGSIVVVQRQVRPQILTSSSIQGAIQLWTVGNWTNNQHSRSLVQENDDPLPPEGSQRFLLVSKEVVTMVLELGSEISELESSGFAMEQRTVAAGDLCDGRFIVQVCPMLVVLLEGDRQLHSLPLQISFPVAHASILDRFVVIVTENGEIVFLELVQEEEEFRLSVNPISVQQAPATAIHVYKDFSGLFMLSDASAKHTIKPPVVKPEVKTETTATSSDSSKKPSSTLKAEGPGVDDEDALLYGDTGGFNPKPVYKLESLQPEASVYDSEDIYFEGTEMSGTRKDPRDIKPSYWVLVARENGFLEIFSLPTFQLVYLVKKFPLGFKTIQDTDPLSFQTDVERPDEHFPTVREIGMFGLGPNRVRPYLFAVSSDEVFVYEAFSFDDGYGGHLALRFRRVPHAMMLRNYRMVKGKKRTYLGAQVDTSITSEETQLDPRYFPRILNFFEDLGSNGEKYYGVFLTGLYPYWVMVLESGEFTYHPMSFDGPVRSITPFHNPNCKKGFLLLSGEESLMRICQLSSDIDLSHSYPVKRVVLGRSVHFVTYLLDSHTYALTTSTKVSCKKIVNLVGDDKQFENLEKTDDPNFVYPLVEQFKVELFVPDTWEPIPGAGELVMEEFEHVTVMKEVKLNSEGRASGFQNYLAVGTIENYGEEVLVRGRIFIVEIIEVVPEPGQPLTTKNKMKVIYSKEQKNPVSSMCSCQGYLLTGMGQKVYIWQFKDNDLQGISFIDMQCYIHQMVSLRNLALVADVYNSVALVRYQDYCKALSIASRDFRLTPIQVNPMGIEYTIDNKQLGMLVADEDKNIHVLTYQPEDKMSLGGQRLIPKGEMNIGTRIANFARIQGHVSDPIIDNKVVTVNRHVNLFGSLDGSLGFFIPVTERTYRRLHTLQTSLSVHLAHRGGLNPKGARSMKGLKGGYYQAGQQTKSCIIDGDVVWEYLNLSVPEKHDVAKRIGSVKEQLLDDLLEVARSSTHF